MDIFKPGVLNVPNTEWNQQVLCVTFPEWRGLKWAIVGSGYPGGSALNLSGGWSKGGGHPALLIGHIIFRPLGIQIYLLHNPGILELQERQCTLVMMQMQIWFRAVQCGADRGDLLSQHAGGDNGTISVDLGSL